MSQPSHRSVRERVERDDVFLDSAVIAHGFTSFLRDYDVIIEIGSEASAPDDGSRRRYRFTHCTEASARTTVASAAWRQSWDDLFTDRAAWEGAGEPDGYVWGLDYSLAYPGLSYVEGSERARWWADHLGRPMHEVRIETNAVLLEIVFHDLQVSRLQPPD